MTRFDPRRSTSVRLAVASVAVATVALAQAGPIAVVHVAPRPATCVAPLTVCIRIPA